jgi:hypothetical protein
MSSKENNMKITRSILRKLIKEEMDSRTDSDFMLSELAESINSALKKHGDMPVLMSSGDSAIDLTGFDVLDGSHADAGADYSIPEDSPPGLFYFIYSD